MMPVITSINQLSSETLSLVKGDLNKEYVKLISMDKYFGYMSIATTLAFPAIFALMFIFKVSEVNWTTVFVFLIFVQSSVLLKGKLIKMKIDMIKLASLNAEAINRIS